MRDMIIGIVRGEDPKPVSQIQTEILQILIDSPNELFYEFGIDKATVDNLRDRIQIELLARSLGISTGPE